MSRISRIHSLLDRVAAINGEIVHATQELVYFFFVVFLVDLKLWPHSFVAPLTGGVLMTLATFRLLYYLSPYILQYTIKGLPPAGKLELVSTHEAGSKDSIEAVLKVHLRLRASKRIAELLTRLSKKRLITLLGLE